MLHVFNSRSQTKQMGGVRLWGYVVIATSKNSIEVLKMVTITAHAIDQLKILPRLAFFVRLF